MTFRSSLGWLAFVAVLAPAAGCQCGGTKLSSRLGEIGVVVESGSIREKVSRDALYDFGGIALGQTGNLKLVVRNLGTAPVQLTQLTFVSGEPTTIGPTRGSSTFGVAFAPTSIAAGSEAQFAMEFSPRVDGASATAELSLRAEGTSPDAQTARIVLKGSTAGCGNQVVDPQETCDPPSSCPTSASCGDGDACTIDALGGSASSCTAACTHTAVTTCADGDGCCPRTCTAATDNDCAGCGNGKLEAAETCDPPSSCASSCSDGNACTTDVMAGSPATCDVACTHAPVTACHSGDGCCPSGCTGVNDSDCSGCGNMVIDGNETCDPPGSCPTSCSDGNACTADQLTGSASACTAACRFTPITSCLAGDGCCASGCTPTSDSDCNGCGNGRLELGETCDPPGSCPSTCSDANACTTDSMTGSALSCTLACSHTPITSCHSGDGCCPSGCTGLNDTDCTGCGNAVCDSPTETCENCVSDCGSGYSIQTPNAACSGGTNLTTFGKWCSTELVILGTYSPAVGNIVVDVIRTHPHVLALTSHDAASWLVRLSPGHQLQKIIVSGVAAQTITITGGSVPVVHYDTPSTWLGCGDLVHSDCDMASLRRNAETAAATPATLYLGCPEMSSAQVN